MIALATDVKVDVSMRIDGRGDRSKVALATKVSVVAASPCTVDGSISTVGFCICGGPERRLHGHVI